MITKAGKNEGTLNLIAWEGYTYKQWVNPVPEGDRVQGAFEVRQFLGRDGDPDADRASTTRSPLPATRACA